jgi:hypothetical protein
MTKGQIAMVAAMAFNFPEKVNPESDQRSRGRQDDGKSGAAKAAGVDPSTFAKALLVRDYAVDLVPQVTGGSMALKEAYQSAQERKKQADWRNDGLRMLRAVAPDLADRVRDEEISLEDGRKQHEERLRAEATIRDSVLFPMMEGDDLAALADDIKENGLQQPIVIDTEGRLIDGRNRLAACDQAGVEPEWRLIEVEDAEAFIWSANVKRRQMTKGQIAMVAAMGSAITIIADPEKRQRGNQDEGKGKIAMVAAMGFTVEPTESRGGRPSDGSPHDLYKIAR